MFLFCVAWCTARNPDAYDEFLYDFRRLFFADSVDLLSVAIHEIGHNLGLDHSNVKRSIMYPFIQNDVQTLHDDDVKGIQNLYGSPISNKPGILCYTIYHGLLLMFSNKSTY